MIVIAIIACLSMISMPSLDEILAKAKRAEAYMHLRAWPMLKRPILPNLAPIRKSRYLVWAGSLKGCAIIPTDLAMVPLERSHFVGQLKTPASALAGASVGANGFTIYAAGHIYGEKPDILTVDQHGAIKIVHDGLR